MIFLYCDMVTCFLSDQILLSVPHSKYLMTVNNFSGHCSNESLNIITIIHKVNALFSCHSSMYSDNLHSITAEHSRKTTVQSTTLAGCGGEQSVLSSMMSSVWCLVFAAVVSS